MKTTLKVKKVFEIEKIKESNLFFLVEKESDLRKLSFLKLSKIIKDNIKKQLSWKESKLETYFLWNSNVTNLYIYTISKTEKTDINYLLWEVFPKLPNNLTCLTNTTQNLEVLMNNSILSKYTFQDYKSKKIKQEYSFLIDKSEEKIFDSRKKTIENIILARDLANTPSNDLYPEAFAKIVKNTKFKNTKVKIFDYKKIQKLKMGLLEAVWKGSHHKPHMIILEKIVDKKLPTIWLVWKWVTFDTGWIQVKPDKSMYEMKWDMCWAVNVFTIAKELDKKDLKVNVVYAMMLAENHISWESFKPSDIFTSYSGKTVDIIHTDAEWRLVLADWISYISKNYKLEKVISMATLTWACMVALGFRYAWIMWNDDKLIDKFLTYSENNFEKYSRLPFDDYFVEKTKSEIADVKNLTEWIYAGSTMWAAFLANFVLNKEKYTHLDIAWAALNSYEPYWYAVKGMTGFWVDSVSHIVSSI